MTMSTTGHRRQSAEKTLQGKRLKLESKNRNPKVIRIMASTSFVLDIT